MDRTQQIIATLELDEYFNDCVTLQTLIGNDNARTILQAWVDAFFNDRISGLAVEYVPILLVGQSCLAETVARAVSNSVGNLLCHTISAQFLNDNSLSLYNFLTEGNEHSTYYIEANKLNSNCQLQLFKILKEKWIWFYSYESQKWEKRPFQNRLIILSTPTKDELSPLLLRQFKIRVNLAPLNQNQIESAIKQRLALLNLKISSEIPAKIAQCCPDDIGKAIEILAMSHMMSRSRLDGSDAITEKHINRALHLLDKNHIKQAP
jgi:Holliday junction resolvasome RuvABC ATP-dependent DNA helicase subunit